MPHRIEAAEIAQERTEQMPLARRRIDGQCHHPSDRVHRLAGWEIRGASGR